MSLFGPKIRTTVHGDWAEYQPGISARRMRKFIESQNLRGMRVFAHLPEQEKAMGDLSSLKDFSFLEGFSLSYLDPPNTNFLKWLNGLRHLRLGAVLSKVGKRKANLSHMNHLQELWFDTSWDIEGLPSLSQLKTLTLEEVRPNSLSNLPILPQVEILLLISSRSIKSLTGIDRFPNLSRLEIAGCPQSIDLSAASKLEHLKSFRLFGQIRSESLARLSKCDSLEEVHLTDSRRIQTLQPFLKSPRLRKVVIGPRTHVMDNSLLALREGGIEIEMRTSINES